MAKKKYHKAAKQPLPTPPAHTEAATPDPVQSDSGVAFLDRLRPFALLLPAAAAVLAYGACVNNGFVFFDDDKAILYNPALRNATLVRIFSTSQNLGMYAPVTWSAYWIGQGLSGQEPWGYHLISLMLHVVNAVLVFGLIRKLTARLWPALFVSAVFAAHPMHAEAVCWAAAQSTVLFTLFYIAALWVWPRYGLPHEREAPGGAVIPALAAAVGLFTLAVLSKSAAVTLPALIAAILALHRVQLLFRYGAALGLMGLIALWFGYNTFQTRALEGHDIEGASAAFSAADRFLMSCHALFFYPVKLLAPVGYSIAYPFVKQAGGLWHWTYYVAPLLLLAVGAAAWFWGRKNREIWLALALYLVPLTVMLPLRTVGSFELRSDRYAYFSSIGIFLLVAIFLEKIKTPAIRYALLGGVLVGLIVLSNGQTRVWNNGVALFENCVDKTPESALCQCNLGYNALISLDYERSIAHYSEALKYDPNTIEAFNGRGQAYLQLQQFEKALADFDDAIRSGISTPKLYFNRGKCLVVLNRPEEAIPDLSRSLELEPRSAETWYYRGAAFDKMGRAAEAVADYGKALELQPDYMEAAVNRGLIRYRKGDYAGAEKDYVAGLLKAPESVRPMILVNLANARLQMNRLSEALSDVEQALAINSGYARAYQTRAAIYQKMGKTDLAERDLARARE